MRETVIFVFVRATPFWTAGAVKHTWPPNATSNAEIDLRNEKVQIEERIEVLSGFVSEDVSAGSGIGSSMRRFLLVC